MSLAFAHFSVHSCSFSVSATLAPKGKQWCVVTLDAYVAVHGQEPAEQTNSSVARSVFGWRELDGVVDNFPTDHSENVFHGDAVPAFHEVHINPCYSWCV